MSDTGAAVFTTTDPQGRSVTLTRECFVYPILVEHPDLSDVDEIEQTVRAPDTIGEDAVDPERLVYYRYMATIAIPEAVQIYFGTLLAPRAE